MSITELIASSELIKDEHIQFLDMMKHSGANMFDAISLLMKKDPKLSQSGARRVFDHWKNMPSNTNLN